ncbi:hypothetical protein B0H11DRAFT_1938191 [Mycena galericulata]|nr:hypothetical protein B0H11DRAFT_1938191 [Mycena galericulata]
MPASGSTPSSRRFALYIRSVWACVGDAARVRVTAGGRGAWRAPRARGGSGAAAGRQLESPQEGKESAGAESKEAVVWLTPLNQTYLVVEIESGINVQNRCPSNLCLRALSR